MSSHGIRKELALLTPRSRTSGTQNWEKVPLPTLWDTVCGTLSWQPQQNGAGVSMVGFTCQCGWAPYPGLWSNTGVHAIGKVFYMMRSILTLGRADGPPCAGWASSNQSTASKETYRGTGDRGVLQCHLQDRAVPGTRGVGASGFRAA